MPFAHRESKVYVAKSAVSGYGVYSKQIIRKGEIVCLYSGVVLGASAMLGNTSDYVLDLGGGWYLDGADRYNCSGRYINDARGFREFRNNARYSSTLIWDDELGWHVNVRATRHIPANREIFASYGSDYWSKHTCVYGTSVRRGVHECFKTCSDQQLLELDKDIGISS